MPEDDDLRELLTAIHQARLRLAREIERARRVLAENGTSQARLEQTESRLQMFSACIRTGRSVH